MENAKDKNQELIERFFSKSLSDKELELFNEKIQTDSNFAKEVNIYRTIYLSDPIPSAKEMATYHKPTQSNFKIWGLFISAFVLLTFAIWFYLKSSTVQEKSLDSPILQEDPKKNIPTAENLSPATNPYLELYTIPDNLIAGLKNLTQEPLEHILTPGLKAFANDEFEQVILAFKNIDPQNHPKEYEISQEYLAHAYFNENNFVKAAEIFQVIETESKLTNARSTLQRMQWYLLLSLVSQNDGPQRHVQEINRLLEVINSQEIAHNYSSLGQALKIQLEKTKE